MVMITNYNKFLIRAYKNNKTILPSCRHEQGGIWKKWRQGCGTFSERYRRKHFGTIAIPSITATLKSGVLIRILSSYSTHYKGDNLS